MAQGHLGNVAMRQGEFSKSLRYNTNAYDGFISLGYRQGVGNANSALGSLWVQIGWFEKSLSLVSEALEIFYEVEALRNRDQSLAFRALVHNLMENFEAGLKDSQLSLEGAKERNDRHVMGYALTALADAQVALGEGETAVSAYEEAIELRTQTKEFHLRVETQTGLADYYMNQGQQADAMEQVEQIITHLEKASADGVNLPGRTYWTCYQILNSVQDERAEALLKEAYDYLTEFAATIDEPEYLERFWQDVNANQQIKKAFESK